MNGHDSARAIWLVLAALAALGTTGCKLRRRHHGKMAAATPPPIALPMVSIPAGRFTMGSSTGDRDERPPHAVSLDHFSIQRTLVTLAQYRACEELGACSPTVNKPYCNEHIAGRDDHPMNCVTWPQARAFCAWAGARLPTEEEWEYAARGTDGRKFPWGNDPPATQVCWDGTKSDLGMMKRRSTCAVEAHAPGASPFGVLDMAGNVWQWTSDLVSQDYDSRRVGPKRVVRGGTWYAYDGHDLRSTLRFREREGIEDYGTGFRCAR